MQSKPTSSSPRATPLKPKSSDLPRTGVTHLIHRSTGKIARLPREARELLNVMLRDGAPYALISKKMAETGHKISEKLHEAQAAQAYSSLFGQVPKPAPDPSPPSST